MAAFIKNFSSGVEYVGGILFDYNSFFCET